MFKVVAPVAGIVAKISIKEGVHVEKGQIVALLQCMKTEIPVVAGSSGVVNKVLVEEGDEIGLGDAILELS